MRSKLARAAASVGNAHLRNAHLRNAVLAGAILGGVALGVACSTPPERLTVEGRTITIFNDSSERWTGVEIWVNDHYRVTRDAIAPGERFQAPLETFVAGFGQRFTSDRAVSGIEVTATDAGGDAVRLVWGNGRRR